MIEIKFQDIPVSIYSRLFTSYWRGNSDGGFGGYVDRDHAHSWPITSAYRLIAVFPDDDLELHFIPNDDYLIVINPHGDSPWMAAIRTLLKENERLKQELAARIDPRDKVDAVFDLILQDYNEITANPSL